MNMTQRRWDRVENPERDLQRNNAGECNKDEYPGNDPVITKVYTREFFLQKAQFKKQYSKRKCECIFLCQHGQYSRNERTRK